MWHMPKGVHWHSACLLWWRLLAAPVWHGVVFSWHALGSQYPWGLKTDANTEPFLVNMLSQWGSSMYNPVSGIFYNDIEPYIMACWRTNTIPPVFYSALVIRSTGTDVCTLSSHGIWLSPWSTTYVPASVVLWVPLLPIKQMNSAHIWNFNQICTSAGLHLSVLCLILRVK